MSIIVQKFGGTSVASIEKISNVARKVVKEINKGNQVVVVVSAMAGVTDQLVDWTKEISGRSDKSFFSDEELAEYDTIVASGEQVTSGLLAIALLSKGIKSRSYLGWQIPFHTKGFYSDATIENIRTQEIKSALSNGEVPIIAGFQGVNAQNRITTLGRGGSDISAVALSVKLEAKSCDIYTDVDGVFTADPNFYNKARKLNHISYEEMLDMSSLGAKVLHERAVLMAMKHNMALRVMSSFSENSGTLITGSNDENLRLVTGIAHRDNESIITLYGLIDKPGSVSKILTLLNDEKISTEGILQSISRNDIHADLSITLPKNQVDAAVKILENNKKLISYKKVSIENKISKISIICPGIIANSTTSNNSHLSRNISSQSSKSYKSENSNILIRIFRVLEENEISAKMIITSGMKVSIVIPSEDTKKAITSLHEEFELEKIDDSNIVHLEVV